MTSNGPIVVLHPTVPLGVESRCAARSQTMGIDSTTKRPLASAILFITAPTRYRNFIPNTGNPPLPLWYGIPLQSKKVSTWQIAESISIMESKTTSRHTSVLDRLIVLE